MLCVYFIVLFRLYSFTNFTMPDIKHPSRKAIKFEAIGDKQIYVPASKFWRRAENASLIAESFNFKNLWPGARFSNLV